MLPRLTFAREHTSSNNPFEETCAKNRIASFSGRLFFLYRVGVRICNRAIRKFSYLAGCAARANWRAWRGEKSRGSSAAVLSDHRRFQTNSVGFSTAQRETAG